MLIIETKRWYNGNMSIKIDNKIEYNVNNGTKEERTKWEQYLKQRIKEVIQNKEPITGIEVEIDKYKNEVWENIRRTTYTYKSREIWEVIMNYDKLKEGIITCKHLHVFIETTELESLLNRLIEDPEIWYTTDFWFYSDYQIYVYIPELGEFCKSDKNDFIIGIDEMRELLYYSCEDRELTEKDKKEIFELIMDTMKYDKKGFEYTVEEIKDIIEKSKTTKELYERLSDELFNPDEIKRYF